jgi:hypothetical protein
MGSRTALAVVAVASLGVGGGLATYWFLLRPLFAPVATACLVDPSGGCGPDVTLTPGQTMELAVTVPSTSQPVSVQAVINGSPAGVHPWNVTQTGYTYTIDFGGAADDPSTNSLYAIVTYADGTTSTTNTVTLTIS